MRDSLENSVFKKNILYLGDKKKSSTSRHRADALRRIGCDVFVVDPSDLIGPRRRYQSFLDNRTGFRFLQRKLLRTLQADQRIVSLKPQLIWVNGGELIGTRVLTWLLDTFKSQAVLYNNDDPTGWRDRCRFATLRSSLSLYRLCAFCRPETAIEALALGAQRTMRVMMSYDEFIHTSQLCDSRASHERLVSFVGTFISREGRDNLLMALNKAGLPLSIKGGRWQQSRSWSILKDFYHGPGVSGQAYAKSLTLPSISLGLLSHQNRDLLTQRSFEIPACYGLLCAERTSEHQLLYEDNYEAVFWDSADECISTCHNLLSAFKKNEIIRRRGYQHVQRIGAGNEDVCRQILRSI